jgi:hypothetical protein
MAARLEGDRAAVIEKSGLSQEEVGRILDSTED